MTRGQIAKHWAVMEAFKSGKIVEFFCISKEMWIESSDPDFYFDIEYRIKPEPKWRPWKSEEVPVGAQTRRKERPAFRMLIVSVYEGGLYCNAYGNTFTGVLCDYEHSLDNGKTWQPCGILE
jgi:hypothetical protein